MFSTSPKEYLVSSQIAGELLIEAEQALYNSTQFGEQAEKAAMSLTGYLETAIQANDLDALFKLEHGAIERDIICYGAEDKRLNAIGGLEQVALLLQKTSTFSGARDYLLSLNDGKNLPKKIPDSDLVQNFIKTQKAQLTQMICATSSQSLKIYRTRRKDALDHIKRQYIKNLNCVLKP